MKARAKLQFSYKPFRWCFKYCTFLQKMFSMTKIGRFLRRFLIVDKTQHQKLMFLYRCDIFKAMDFYGLISNSCSYSLREKTS